MAVPLRGRRTNRLRSRRGSPASPCCRETFVAAASSKRVQPTRSRASRHSSPVISRGISHPIKWAIYPTKRAGEGSNQLAILVTRRRTLKAACLHAFEQNSRERRCAPTALLPHRLQYTSSSACCRFCALNSLRFAVIFALNFLRTAAWHSGEQRRTAKYEMNRDLHSSHTMSRACSVRSSASRVSSESFARPSYGADEAATWMSPTNRPLPGTYSTGMRQKCRTMFWGLSEDSPHCPPIVTSVTLTGKLS
jgi:hypothetical protein